MPDFIERFRSIVEDAAVELTSCDAEAAARQPAPGKWSACEILGHLIDSAANNHRRFVVAPSRNDLVFEGYEQDAWVALQRYDQAAWEDLVLFWRAYNLHIAHVMAAVPVAVRERPYARHNFHEIAFRAMAAGEPATLAWLMEDYVLHLEHHLRQIRLLLAGRPTKPTSN